MTRRVVFRGDIAGIGSTSGIRVVVGRWPDSPYGDVADAMVETADGHRVLLAPSRELADFVAATYAFDEVRVEPFTVTVEAPHAPARRGPGRAETTRLVRSPSLELRLTVGRPTLLGRLVALVPRRIAEAPLWCAVTDPVARVVLRGVRTRGSAGNGRREWYGATGVRAVTGIAGRFDGADLGRLADVVPPARFGFSSTPRRPALTSVATTIELAPGELLPGT